MVNDKHLILEALISSNNNVWGEFNMHPLITNMGLATAAAAQARGGLLSQEAVTVCRNVDGPEGRSLYCSTSTAGRLQDGSSG